MTSIAPESNSVEMLRGACFWVLIRSLNRGLDIGFLLCQYSQKEDISVSKATCNPAQSEGSS
jgi:hypothetical protein